LRTTAPGFWDAADEMPAPSLRTLYVGFSDTAFGTQPALWSGVDANDLGLVSGDESIPLYKAIMDSGGDRGDIANAIVESFSGCEFGSSPCTPRTNDTGGPTVLGDIFHSNPIVVGSPNSAVNEDAYGKFAIDKRTRSRVIYAGANDGFLHAFNAGDWQTLEADGITPRVPPSHDHGTGVELFGFMPYAVRNTAKVLPTRLSFPRAFPTIDGSPVVSDVWFYRDVDNSGKLQGVNSTLTEPDKVKEQWRTVLMGGLRNGGQSYYALDITNPPRTGDSPPSDYPLYLWEFPCEDCGASKVVNPGTSSEALWMGSTWSEPVITRVRVASDTGSDPEGYERWVAIFGAGHDACGDPYSGFYDDPSACAGRPREAKGRAIYMVDITTGEVLAKKFWSSSPVKIPSGSGTQIGFPEMRYAFASAPAVFDVDFDGFADVVYIGDLGGNIWKWVISDIGDDPINNTSSDSNVAQPDWDFRIFFQAGSASSPVPATYDASYTYQSFFFPATGVLRHGKLVIALGAGQRANTQYPDSDGLDATNNHYYVLTDRDPRERGLSPPDPLTGFLDEDDLATNAQLDSVSCIDLHTNFDGYFLTGRDAEKFITNSVIFTGELFFGSFIPPDPMTTNPCEATGQAFLYILDLDCGVGSFDNPGSGNEDRRKFVGTGLPTRPRVSVGGLNEENQTPSCNNKVIVITSDGGIESKCKTLPSKGIDVRSWRTR